MRSAPSWLVQCVREIHPAGPTLWVGPELAFPEELGVKLDGDGTGGEPVEALLIAAVEGDLAPALRSLRPRCAPGAAVALLLPEPGAGMRGQLSGLFGALGRKGRVPRSRAEQCGALLSLGAQGIRVASFDGRHSCILGLLPREVVPLDGEFAPAAPV